MEATYGEMTMKIRVFYADLSSLKSLLIRVSTDLKTSFSERDRDREKKRERDFLYKYKLPLQKGNFYSVFKASPLCTVSQNSPKANKSHED